MRLGNLLLGLSILLTVGCSRGSLLKNDDSRGQVCTLLGCIDGFSVTLRANDNELPLGTYDVWMEVDGATTTHCQIVASGPTPTQSGDCDLVAWGYLEGKSKMGMISYNNSQGEVSSLVITFIKDGALIAQRDLRPVYQLSYPNGERCGGACRQAPSVDIPVDL